MGIGPARAGDAMAQPGGGEDADAKAAARFQRAVELYREGSYEGALAEFRKAYQISPAYRVIYNIAQSQYAMHDFVGAYKSLVGYMTEGSGEIPADRRIQVDEMFAKLRDASPSCRSRPMWRGRRFASTMWRWGSRPCRG